MKPGEILVATGEIVLNKGRETITVTVANSGDRPVQVGSHYHFYETNAALRFDRESARGYRLDIPAGTAVRFEPGQQREGTRVTTNLGLAHAVTDDLAATELYLLAIDRFVVFNFDEDPGMRIHPVKLGDGALEHGVLGGQIIAVGVVRPAGKGQRDDVEVGDTISVGRHS